MRALGASRRVIATAQGSEFLLMGALAGLLAASAAAGIGLFVAERVFQFSYQVNLWIWCAVQRLDRRACRALGATGAGAAPGLSAS